MHKLTNTSRYIVAFASLILGICFFVPLWRIDLFAPQYPEGLTMKIWLSTIKGDIDIINGLNHYIGMKHINVEMFPEFSFLKYIVLFYILLGLLVSYLNDVRILFWYLVFTFFGGVFSMFDFYRWGYEYGHNLDPTAAIKIPGMSYQPPLFGHKRLLNFDSYSFPDIGGWVIFSAATIMLLILIYEKYKAHIKVKNGVVIAALPLLFFMASCNSDPQAFKFGSDICVFCKMGIVDPKFGAEIITKKGKIFKFDDTSCLVEFLKSNSIKNNDIKNIWVINSTQENHFVEVGRAFFVIGNDVRTPMNSNTIAFSSKDAAVNYANVNSERKIVIWSEIYESQN